MREAIRQYSLIISELFDYRRSVSFSSTVQTVGCDRCIFVADEEHAKAFSRIYPILLKGGPLYLILSWIRIYIILLNKVGTLINYLVFLEVSFNRPLRSSIQYIKKKKKKKRYGFANPISNRTIIPLHS
jgi:hypothetical protein